VCCVTLTGVDLSRDDYTKAQIQKNRVRKQVAGPAPTGQMALFDDQTPPPLVEGTTLHSPEQKAINDRGLTMVRGILASRSASFTSGHTPVSPDS